MQIHELNTYNGDIDSGYIAMDDGSDTGKVSGSTLLADVRSDLGALDTSLNARIDNIIAGGSAPSEAEIIDARLGDNGIIYSSLGDAIRGQFADVKSDLYPPVLELGSIKFPHVKTVSPNGSYRWATTRIIPEGATVKFKNNTTVSLTLNVQRADATEQNISTGVAANGGIVTFVAPFDIYYIRSWVGNTTDYDVEVEYGFDNSVSMTMFKNMAAFDVKNIFTLKGASEGSFIYDNGNVGTSQYVGRTDYIDISSYWGELVLSLLADPDNNVNIYQGAFFDKDKNYISGYRVTGVTSDIDYSINIPNGAQFIIFDYLLNRAPDYYIKATTKNSKAFSMYADSIFTLEGATDGAYVDSTTGEIIATSSASVTDYINVSLASKIITVKYDQVRHQGAFYDINKNYVSGYYRQWNDPQGAFEIPVPDEAYYIRFSYITSHAADYYATAIIREREEIASIILTYAEAMMPGIRFSDMKMNCLGDSITWGYIPDSGSRMPNPYPSIIKNLLGLSECRNYGISGSTLAVNSGNYDPMCIRYANMDDDADIVLVFGGTNDYGRAIYTPDLGSISDTVNTSVYGALNILCDGLITKYPKALIFLCTPLKRADKTAANGGGYTLEDVAEAIRNIGKKYGMPVLDLNYEGGFYISNATFRAQYGGNDKLHPNQAFNNDHLAPMIARFIEGKI